MKVGIVGQVWDPGGVVEGSEGGDCWPGLGSWGSGKGSKGGDCRALLGSWGMVVKVGIVGQE